MKVGLFWRGLFHDMSKFLLSEFIPYAKYFYNEDGSLKQIRDNTGYYKPTDTGDKNFDFAWHLHSKRNRHHWQWWIQPDFKNNKVLEMKYEDVMEMICDWKGAGKAQKTPNVLLWYKKNKNKMILHPNTRKLVEKYINKV